MPRKQVRSVVRASWVMARWSQLRSGRKGEDWKPRFLVERRGMADAAGLGRKRWRAGRQRETKEGMSDRRCVD